MTKPKVFVSYCREDLACKEELCKHLDSLAKDQRLEFWSDNRLRTGDPWNAEIENRIQIADVFVQIISAHYLSSEFCIEFEVRLAIEKWRQGRCIMFPIIAKYCPWQEIGWLADLQCEGIDEPIWEIADDSRRGRVLSEIARRIARADAAKEADEAPEHGASLNEPEQPIPVVARLSSPEVRRHPSVTTKIQVMTVFAVFVVLLSLVLYLFRLAHDDYRGPAINLDSSVSLKIDSKKYLSPGDETELKFDVSNTADKPRTTELDLKRSFGESGDMLFKGGPIRQTLSAQKNETLGPIKIKPPTWSAQFGPPAPAGVVLTGNVDGEVFQGKPLLLYIAPVPKVGLLLNCVGISTLVFGMVLLWTYLAHMFRQFS